MSKLCVFAGTADGRRLIERICGRGASIVACVATEYGEVSLGVHPEVEVRAGRLDRAAMEEMLRAEKFDLVVDATHPYAEAATGTIRAACAAVGAEYLRLLRENDAGDGDGVFVPDTDECIEYLKTTSGPILLTTGSKTLPRFCGDAELRPRLWARVLPLPSSLEICEKSGLAADRIIAMQGPFTRELNTAMLRFTGARLLVTKETGSAGGYREKIAAAKEAGATAVIIGRPSGNDSGGGVEETAAEIERRFSLKPPPKKVSLIGIGMGNAETRTLGMERAVREADCLIGARRMLDSVSCAGKETHSAILADDIEQTIRDSACRRFAVLLSGDTGFYSGAKALVSRLSDLDVEVLPGIGSLSYFCSRLHMPWENVRAVSMHGRDCDIVRLVGENPAVFTLLGGKDNANTVLRALCEAGFGSLTAHVGQRLGYPDERVVTGTAEELMDGVYDPLSVLLVENPDHGSAPVTHGLPDEAFLRDEVPMTKSEVRSVSLSKLMLTKNAVVWDVGAGSGSVTVECALLASGGRVYAVEMKEKALALLEKNVEKFRLRNVTVVPGAAPEALEPLPAPTHAFIGGSSGSLRPIIDLLLRKNPEVRIVANAVTLETAAELTSILKEFTFSEVTELNVSRARRLGRYDLMTAQNPVYIYTFQGRKPE